MFHNLQDKLKYDLAFFKTGQMLQGCESLYENADKIAAIKKICEEIIVIPFTAEEEARLLQIDYLPEVMYDLLREDGFEAVKDVVCILIDDFPDMERRLL